jgi:phenylalanine-4-hydroxylase
MPASEIVPDYLRPFIAKQDPSLYTPIDHASWRFILRVSKAFFSKHAHPKYLSGLEETGISTERIPLVEEMDERLKRFGWRAVAVSGFIPPAVFMEFQSMGILPIACEMRTLEHLAYTPAPDIVHEAAGHAPIIADPEYSAYLRAYGEISRKAIFSYQDMDVYEAVRNLSIVKEDPKSTEDDIARAQKRLDQAVDSVTFASEATLMARMNWWTVEYGLVGPLDSPKIYGAGLLSSMGESYHCLGPNVRRMPLTVGCIEQAYDITKPQPQLFVTPDFPHLVRVLNEFAETMAFRKGGDEGLAKAVQARTVCTAELDSGLQVSGVFEAWRPDPKTGEPAYFRCQGPTQLSYREKELPDQGPDFHREGFSTAIGNLEGFGRPASELTDEGLAAYDRDGITTLRFASGIEVAGRLKGVLRREGRIVILSFTACKVVWTGAGKDEVLFHPEWGTFDLACGGKVVSVFGGAADRRSYVAKTGGFKQMPMVPKCNLTSENAALNELYARVRALREKPLSDLETASEIASVETALEKAYPTDWLLRLEILELLRGRKIHSECEARLRSRLMQISKLSRDRDEMISRGLALVDSPGASA